MCIKRTFFFFNDTATTEIYTLSLHDALPISNIFSNTNENIDYISVNTNASIIVKENKHDVELAISDPTMKNSKFIDLTLKDRKSTRLNSSHANISYAVFCLKKKKNR